jgi:Skp family chaperone for outer membrane proteins
MFCATLSVQYLLCLHLLLQDLVSKLRQEQRAHPKALQQAEKQRVALERKLEASERRQAGLERDSEGLQERLGKQEAEKAAVQEQVRAQHNFMYLMIIFVLQTLAGVIKEGGECRNILVGWL